MKEKIFSLIGMKKIENKSELQKMENTLYELKKIDGNRKVMGKITVNEVYNIIKSLNSEKKLYNLSDSRFGLSVYFFSLLGMIPMFTQNLVSFQVAFLIYFFLFLSIMLPFFMFNNIVWNSSLEKIKNLLQSIDENQVQKDKILSVLEYSNISSDILFNSNLNNVKI